LQKRQSFSCKRFLGYAKTICARHLPCYLVFENMFICIDKSRQFTKDKGKCVYFRHCARIARIALATLFCAFNSNFRCLARRVIRRYCEPSRKSPTAAISSGCVHGSSSQYALSIGKVSAKKYMQTC
jgi:hypothetical protein